MKTYRLKEKDIEFFKAYMPRSNFMALITNAPQKNNRYEVSLSKDQASLLVEELTLAFINIGLKEDDEPNELGLYIENLIDLFNPIHHIT